MSFNFKCVKLAPHMQANCPDCADYRRNPLREGLTASYSPDGETIYAVYCPYCRGHLKFHRSSWTLDFRRVMTFSTWLIVYVMFAVLRLGRKDHPWRHVKWGHFFTPLNWATYATDTTVTFGFLFTLFFPQLILMAVSLLY